MSPPSSPAIPLPKDGEELLDLKDLSLSDLSLPDTPRPSKPFSLFAETPEPPNGVASASSVSQATAEEESDVFSEPKQAAEPEDLPPGSSKSRSSRTREEKLETELFELKQLNDVFSSYLSALESAKDHNARLASQVDRTNALLDKYVALLGQAQYTQELVTDPNWQGAEADELALLQAQQREKSERARAAREEKERAERAEQERAAKAEREEKDKEERERRETADAGRGRGRGRGATRGASRARGSTATNSSSTRGRIPTSSGIPPPGGTRISTTARASTAGRGARKA